MDLENRISRRLRNTAIALATTTVIGCFGLGVLSGNYVVNNHVHPVEEAQILESITQDTPTLSLILNSDKLTPTNTSSPNPTNTPIPTSTNTYTPTLSPTLEPTPSFTNTSTPTHTNTPLPTPTNTHVPRNWPHINFSYGAHTDLNEWNCSGNPNSHLNLVKDLNFTFVKQLFKWSEAEYAQNAYDWRKHDCMANAINSNGLKLIARIDYQPEWSTTEPDCGDYGPPDNLKDYGDFLADFVRRYPWVWGIEVWNEPNLAKAWGCKEPSPEEYTNMLKVAYRRIKGANPNVYVISSALAATGVNDERAMEDTFYLEKMYQLGAGQYFDFLGAHAHGYKAYPEMSPDEAFRVYGHRTFCMRRLEDLRNIMVRHGDTNKQIIITEIGWHTNPGHHSAFNWFAVSEQQQADYIVRAYDYAKNNWPFVGVMNVYWLGQNVLPNSEVYWWSIINPNGSTRPAYDALRDYMQSIR